MAKMRPVENNNTSSATDSDFSSVLTPFRARNMIFPLAIAFGCMGIAMVWTGAHTQGYTGTLWQFFIHGDGAFSVFIAFGMACVFAMVYYRFQQGLFFASSLRCAWNGGKRMAPFMVLMVLAFAIGGVCKELHAGAYLASFVEEGMMKGALPAMFFLLSAVISFSTGTSWGTFSIVLPLVLPVTMASGDSVALSVGAVLGGSVFGDHSSPISDTTLMASLAAGCEPINHVRTQLPYALLGGGVAFLLYLTLGRFFF